FENIARDTYTQNNYDRKGLIAVQGPKAMSILQRLGEEIEGLPNYYCKKGEKADYQDILISTTGNTGSGGFELYVPVDDLEGLWDLLCAEGEREGLLRAGLGARDTLRLEMGYCLYGQDIDEETTPLEAGL